MKPPAYAVDPLYKIWLADADTVRTDSDHIAVLLVQCYVSPFGLASPNKNKPPEIRTACEQGSWYPAQAEVVLSKDCQGQEDEHVAN